MDAAAALGFRIDSSEVVQAANDLDRFVASATKAGAAGGKINIGGSSGSIAKLVAEVQSANSKLTAIVGTLEKIASADRATAAANDNLAKSFGAADAHVNTYRQHLEALATSQAAATAAGVAADAHVVAYTAHLAALSAQHGDANAHVVAYQQALQASAAPQVQLNAHVEAYRRNLATLPPAMEKAATSAGALQANTSNIAAQFQDIGVTAAMGMNPLIIGLQQGTQLAGVFAQSGGTMKQVLVGAFQQIASAQALLTIGLVALVALIIQLGIAWATSGNEADKLAERIANLKTASDGVSDAQSVLGKIFDLTTGKMKNQTAAAINLARAQLLLQQATAQANISKASRDLDSSSSMGFMGRLTAWAKGDRGLLEGSARVDLLTKALRNNDITTGQAMEGFRRLADAGQISNEMFLKATTAAANYGMEIENVKTAQQGLADLDRGKLSQMFINPSKPRKKPKGPKTDAEKLADIYLSANADIAAEKTRGLAAQMEATAFEAAKMEKQTALLNAIQQKGITITDTIRTKVAALADEYAKFKIAADVGEVITSTTDDIAAQRQAIADQTKLIGLYGDALARATREMEAQKRFRDKLPKGEIVVMANLTGGLSNDIENNARLKRMVDLKKSSEDAAYAMNLERAGLGLTGAAALSYAYVVDQLNQRRREGNAITPEELANITAIGDAYGKQRYAIDQQAQRIADAREVTKGFWQDWINGARQGQNVFQSFADSAINALNRIIDKLLDKTLNSFIDGLFQSKGGGLQRASLQTIAANPSIFAKGGAFGTPQRFANGGAFTNTVVNSPTLFRFANGGKLGEMGEAGPEAIMPLKRGPNGALGVQMHGGGRSSIRMGDVHLDMKLEGAVSEEKIVAMVQQAGQAAVSQIRRDFASIAAEYEQNGVVAA
ncbi:phage tail length tape measure family protein [Sphingomonas aquatilis]